MMPVFLPDTLDAALDMLARDPAARVMAGGTDLLVHLRATGDAPGSLVCLDRLRGLKGIKTDGDTVRIGAGVTMTELLDSPVVRDFLPLLHRAAGVFASPTVRNMATIGGNLCTASPAGDTLPPLYVMNASVELRSPRGERTVPVDRFITGPRRTCLERDELVTAVTVPIPVDFDIHHFEKVGQRAAQAIAVVSLAALVALDGTTVHRARLAWGSVGPGIVRCPQAEELLEGQRLTLTNLRAAAAAVGKVVTPISDVRASAEYRRQVAGNLLLRLAAL
jgi:xanthine dehydrogenase FAD-binding subunit